VVASVLADQKTSPVVKASQVLNQGEEVSKFLKAQNLSDQNIQHAFKFVSHVQKLIDDLKPGKNPIIKGFLNNLVSYEHGAGVTVLAGIFSNLMHVSSSESLHMIGIAAFLHDIGLQGGSQQLLDEDIAKMSDEELSIYRYHPVVGAEMLNKIPGIKPVAIQAVLQHHERRDKSGFPYQIGHSTMNPLSELVGLSDEFFKIIKNVKSDPQFNFVEAVNTRILQSFSKPLVSEFKNMFFQTASG
jgi:response regulator RpfG family c-di-GMP phosphodiesterase